MERVMLSDPGHFLPIRVAQVGIITMYGVHLVRLGLSELGQSDLQVVPINGGWTISRS